MSAYSSYHGVGRFAVTTQLALLGAPRLVGAWRLTPPPPPLPFQVAIVIYLLKQEADPNETDKQGNTPLHVAARSGFKTLAQVLVAGGAKQTVNRAGKTPAQVASDIDVAKACEAA